MINVKLLSTTIMLVFGVDGHGQCATQSIIASKVLQRMGYKAKVVGGYHAMMIRTYSDDFYVCHAPINKIPFDLQNANISNENIDENRKWMHCWVETGNNIVDVNLHSISHKKYTNIENWDRKSLIKGKQYYMPTEYDFYQDVIERKVDLVIQTYNQLDTGIEQMMRTEEGPIIIKSDGSWSPLNGYKLNKTIMPHTNVFVKNPNILKELSDIMEE